MVDVDALILGELELVSPLGGFEETNWAEVLDRAQGRRRALSRRRLLIALALLGLLVAVLLATPAFGVRSLILDLFGRTNIAFKATKPAPTIVLRQFAELGVGAPPSMAPQAIVSEARTVTTFHVNGKSHTLWVAPTRRGGFCWTLSEVIGGCLNRSDLARAYRNFKVPKGDVHPELLSLSFVAVSPSSSLVGDVEGVVLTTKATRLTAEFRDGSSLDLPFVFVSPPINAGFVYWAVPRAHRASSTALRAITARDAHGDVVARYVFLPIKQVHIHVQPPKPGAPLPPPPSPLGFHIPAPTAPFQRGSADGASITVGSNGVVVFDTTGVSTVRKALLTGRLGVGCFTIAHDQLGIWPRELTVLRGFGPIIKIRLFGVPHPYDGCEIEATYGHTWPDKFGSHSAVEIPLTATGSTFFADRAAARDLALFVRSKRGHALRSENGASAQRDLAKIGPRLVRLASPAATPPVGKIGYAITTSGIVFVEESETGKRFDVVIENGHIKRQNIKPYGFVF